MSNVFMVQPQGLNIGNEVIAFAMRGLLREALGEHANLIPTPAAGAPASDEAGLVAETVHQMNLYGHGVVVGGGNLYENGRLAVDPNALMCLHPPLLLCSLSYGRIYDNRRRLTRRTDAMPDRLVRALHERAEVSMARDEATLVHLRSLGLSQVELGGCPTMLIDEIVAEPPAAGATGGTLLSIRGPRLMSIPLADMARVHDAVLRLVAALEADGHGPVRVLCHDKRDMAFVCSLGEVDWVLPDDLPSYLRLLGEAALLVSFRLHASVPALALGVPVVNISYDERSQSLMRTLGLADWDIDFVTDADPIAAVRDRVGRLDTLAALRADAEPRWQELRTALRGGIARFAEAVADYAALGASARQDGQWERSRPISRAVARTSSA